jgi:unsaturated chondroitin disaccharide hydrolase
MARRRTRSSMAAHVTHTGVHDHGFNNVSTYGNLLRLMNEGRSPADDGERRFYELALKCSGAVQAARWSPIQGGGGYIYSFNGPHSLFIDTIRTLRALAVGHRLGHILLGENDRRISLLDRLIGHAHATARYSVYYGEGRDAYDVPGRVAHESIFNPNDGQYRCPGSQQGYSPFTTWTRGLAWAMCGFAELVEFLDTLSDEELDAFGGRETVAGWMLRAARATCDFYIENTASDGIPYWDTGAPDLGRLGDWRARPADPHNSYEPADSSAAVIAAQGLLRLGKKLGDRRYWQAGLTVCRTVFSEPYLSTGSDHQGLILNAVYHRPNGWDAIPPGRTVPCGEACMWGDYQAREVALYLLRLIERKPYLTFWSDTLDHC